MPTALTAIPLGPPSNVDRGVVIEGACTPLGTAHANSLVATGANAYEAIDFRGIAAGSIDNSNSRLITVPQGTRELELFLEVFHTSQNTAATSPTIAVGGRTPTRAASAPAQLPHEVNSAYPTEADAAVWRPVANVDGQTSMTFDLTPSGADTTVANKKKTVYGPLRVLCKGRSDFIVSVTGAGANTGGLGSQLISAVASA